MRGTYTRGIAFIMEGATEKVFYREFMKWLSVKNGCDFEREPISDSGDILFRWKNKEEVILIKFNIVGTVTQIAHSGKWFANSCAKKYKLPWDVFICYDTDGSENDISKFYQGDWKVLREIIRRAKAKTITDLAANADIEDVILVDIEDVCDFLKIPMPEKLTGRKGKAKMKALYRSAGKTYHEGDRSVTLIEALDFEKIMEQGPIPLEELKKKLV